MQVGSQNPSWFSVDEKFAWDFLVVGDGEQAMAELLRDIRNGAVPNASGVVVRQGGGGGGRSLAPSQMTETEWSQSPWVDRRLFVAPDGSPYEPAPSHAGTEREAHIVMSRGCSWRCAFCTEAVARNGHELRRTPESVLEEIEWLVVNDGVTRLQFVDDNVLPQIGALHVNRADGLRWARTFLDGWNGLAGRRPRPTWRAIMRFEDLLAYEAHIENFAADLYSAGCRLLAFGVEYGSEERRAAAKGGTVSNHQIASAVSRLHETGIRSKAYFIIGGNDENSAGVDETIQFAINSRFDVAYFALYKAFRLGIAELRQGASDLPVASHELTRKFLRFENLDFDLAEIAASDSATQKRMLGRHYPASRVREARRAAKALAGLGFRFAELFKYSDYHAEGLSDGLRVWEGANTGEFLASVRRAYFEFYLRDGFVPVYDALLRSGY